MSLCIIPRISVINAQLRIWAGTVKCPLPLHLARERLGNRGKGRKSNSWVERKQWKPWIYETFWNQINRTFFSEPPQSLSSKFRWVRLRSFHATVSLIPPPSRGVLIAINKRVLLVKLCSYKFPANKGGSQLTRWIACHLFCIGMSWWVQSFSASW